MRRTARLLLTIAFALATTLSLAAYTALILIPYIFTNQLPIVLGLEKLVWQAVASITFCSFAMVFDGVSIGVDDYQHLPRTNLVATAGCLVVSSTALRTGAGLPGVWMGLVTFFGLRLAMHLLHMAINWRTSAFG